MSKLLKDEIDVKSIKKLAVLLNQQAPDFDIEQFQQRVFCENWTGLTLKQRIRHLSTVLNQQFNTPYKRDYLTCLRLLKPVSVEFSGLFHFVFADFVACFGVDFYEASIEALALFTQKSTAEFAIRVFLESQPENTKVKLLEWSLSDNAHLRRLASEGVRPRLPWAKHLPWIANNPDWVKPIIENLKSDSSLYVRKSVANLLNDLSKTQADWVMDLCTVWNQNQQATSETLWIRKQALRTLLKQANPRALGLIGYPDIEQIQLDSWQCDSLVKIGQTLNWSFRLSAEKKLGLLRVEYAISFLRKRQKPYRKVFKIAESDYSARHKLFSKHHDFKPITTRNYVAGRHKFELLVNGQVIKTTCFDLNGVQD